MTSDAWIRTKSIELDIPFSHILSAYVLELTAQLFATDVKARDFWLCNREALGLDVYRKKVSDQLCYCYTGKAPFTEKKVYMINQLYDMYQEEEMRITHLEEDSIEGTIVLRVGLQVCGMYVPFRIYLQQCTQEHIFPMEEKVRLFLENDKSITLYCYPMEQIAAEQLLLILKPLELIQDMTPYLKLYEIVTKCPLEGRKVQEHLYILCCKEYVKTQESLWNVWSKYGDYGYMEKKWNRLLRKEKRKEPAWQEVHAVLCAFLEPIWKNITEDKIFFGDWMPQLQRYFD